MAVTATMTQAVCLLFVKEETCLTGCLIGRLYLPTSQRELTLKLVHLLEDMFNGKEVASLDHGFNRTRSQSVIAYNKEHTRYKASDLLTAENVYKQLQTSKSAH
eukprot:3472235-Pyramimonas_sp.AAC.1